MTNSSVAQGSLAVNGSGTAPLTVTANGSNALVGVFAYPISFTGGAVTLQSTGKLGHSVNVINPGGLSGKTGLTFGGTGTVTLDASGTSGGAGGNVTIFVDDAIVNSATFTVNAKGPTGTGAGGNASVTWTHTMTLGPSTQATVSADGGTVGGIGGQVHLLGNGTVNLGTGGNAFTLSAQSHSSDGGTIEVGFSDALNVINGGTAVSVAAAGQGNGGQINFHNFGTFLLEAGNVDASAQGTGNQGSVIISGGSVMFTGATATVSANGNYPTGQTTPSISINAGNGITIGSGSGSVALTASAIGSTGNGGSVQVVSGGTLVVNGPSILVTAGNGNGGAINLQGSSISLTGALNANAGTTAGTATGGSITLNAGTLSLQGTISANGSGNGNGGPISITSSGGGNNITISSNINSNSGPAGGVGGNITISSVANISISAATVSDNGTTIGGVLMLSTSASGLVSLTAGGSLIGGPVIVTSPQITNAGTINGYTVTVTGNSGLVLNNTGTIATITEGTNKPGAIEIQSSPNGILIEGAGSYTASNIDISSSKDLTIQDTATWTINSNQIATITAPMGVTLNTINDEFALTGANVGLTITTPTITNEGQISTGKTGAGGNLIVQNGSQAGLNIAGTGSLQCVVLGLIASNSGSVTVSQNGLNGETFNVPIVILATVKLGSFTLSTSEPNLSLGGISTVSGSISVQTTSGNISTLEGSSGAVTSMLATGGSITIQTQTGRISLGDYASFTATSNVTLAVGTISQVPGTPNPNITVNNTSGQLFWGSGGVTAQPGSNNVINIGSQTVTFSEPVGSPIIFATHDTISVN